MKARKIQFIKLVFILFLISLFLAACGRAPTISPESMSTIVAAVVQTLTVQAATPTINVQTQVAQTLTAVAAPGIATIPPPTLPPTLPPPDVSTNPPMPEDTPTALTSAGPEIMYTFVPPLGSSEYLSGKVVGINPEEYAVVVYIRVGGGWWIKPTFADPITLIASDGTWNCQYATGGSDTSATVIRAYLIPTGYNPPAMKGESSLPSSLNNLKFVEATR